MEKRGVFDDESTTPFVDDIDYFKQLIHSICDELNMKSIIFLFDEACHNFCLNNRGIFYVI